jgi:hypothetical protein
MQLSKRGSLQSIMNLCKLTTSVSWIQMLRVKRRSKLSRVSCKAALRWLLTLMRISRCSRPLRASMTTCKWMNRQLSWINMLTHQCRLRWRDKRESREVRDCWLLQFRNRSRQKRMKVASSVMIQKMNMVTYSTRGCLTSPMMTLTRHLQVWLTWPMRTQCCQAHLARTACDQQSPGPFKHKQRSSNSIP